MSALFSPRRVVLGTVIFLGHQLLSCTPEVRPQVLIYLDTDAVIPEIFDRLRVTVLDGRGVPIPSGSREFGGGSISSSTQRLWPLSMGIAVPVGERRLIRAQLYLAGRVLPVPIAQLGADAEVPESAEPDPHSSITVTGSITGSASVAGVQSYRLFIPMRCLLSDGADPSCGTTPTALPAYTSQPTQINSWQSGIPRECAGAPRGQFSSRTSDVCIRGGTYWMGDRRLGGIAPRLAPVPEHLVVLRPFYLDQFEYTVGRYRTALREGRVQPQAQTELLVNPLGPGAFAGGTPRLLPVNVGEPISPCHSPISVTGTDLHCCNFISPDDDSRDTHPLNCVTPDVARRLCAADGKRLASEAEWEWAAGNRDWQTLHSWGDAWQDCQNAAGLAPATSRYEACGTEYLPTHASFSTGLFGCLDPLQQPPVCRYLPNGMDRTRDGISDMMGNVQEIVEDAFSPYAEECWQGTAQQVNPVCTVGIGPAIRGASFGEAGPYSFYSVSRGAWSREPYRQPRQGFRCARDAN